MTKRDQSKDAHATKVRAKQERVLTVSFYPQPLRPVPWIRLCGLWLEQAGFTPRSRIRVRVMTGCLVITKEIER